MKVGEVVSDAANKLIAQVEDGAQAAELETTTLAILAGWRTGASDRHGYARLLRKLTDTLLEQRDAYSRRAAKRAKSDNPSAAGRLEHWSETLNVAVQALRDERAELKTQGRGAANATAVQSARA